MSRVWLFQDSRQKKRLGDKCPWSIGFYVDGLKRSKKVGSKSLAQKEARKLEGQLAIGNFDVPGNKSWSDFRSDYESAILSDKSSRNAEPYKTAMDHFERICKPKKVMAITTKMIDRFVAVRKKEPGKKKNSLVAPATVNKDLRSIKSILGVAKDWKLINEVPKFRMVKEIKKLVRYITPDDFSKIYEACAKASKPAMAATDWWRALLVFNYMTGWRISEPIALKRSDLDLDAGFAITRGQDNKGSRDEQVPLHPIVVEHLQKIVSFHELVFFWPHHRRTLDTEFHRIQTEAGIDLPCIGNHDCTDACSKYGFHDLRRGFASLNASQLAAEALQKMMRHKSYSTTQRYINDAKQLDGVTSKLFVPELRVG